MGATTQDFANALYSAAHGVVVSNPREKYFLFDRFKPKVAELLQLVDRISSDPSAFQDRIATRIGMFVPPDADLKLEGYMIAGGDGGGYAFSGTDFYLNIAMMDEFAVARTTTAHELYHAVQGAFASQRGAMDELPDMSGMSNVQRECVKTRQLFSNLYEEGSTSAIGKRQEDDLDDGIRHLQASASLLEMSVLSFHARPAMSYDDVYSVGFYGHGVLYNIGFAMARAIAEHDGPQGLAVFLKQPPQTFVLRYTQLPDYGKDRDHPPLGPQTVQAAKQISSTCAK